jgi:hypothetical protein
MTMIQIDKPSSQGLRRSRSIASLGALAVALLLLVSGAPRAAAADFGIASFDGAVSNQDGTAFTQAGGHPYQASTTIAFDSFTADNGSTFPNRDAKDIQVGLPPGFVVNPGATPKCNESELEITGPLNVLFGPTCPLGTQVGVVELELAEQFGKVTLPVYNVVPPPGRPAQLAFNVLGQEVVHLFPSVRSGSDFGITADIVNAAQTDPFFATTLTLWGVPADSSHDAQRGQNCVNTVGSGGEACFQGGVSAGVPRRALVSNPTSCAGPQITTLSADSWQNPGAFETAGFLSHDNVVPPSPIGVSGCGQLPFNPTITARPTTSAAETPTGLDVDVHLPEEGLENPTGLASANLKKAVVTLPVAVSVNPSSANGLGACTPAQIGLIGTNFPAPNPIHFTTDPAKCSDSSKIGTVEIDTPLLDTPLSGFVYLAQQGSNPFNSLLAIYIVAEGQGVTLKLPGHIETSQQGQLTATFDNNPQLPFEDLHVEFFGGPRASLMTPPSCGTYTTTAQFTAWSGTPPVSSSDSFKITQGPNGGPCPNGGFNPKLSAGTTNPVAGSYAPFVLHLSREDGTQQLKSLDVTLPKGLVGKLAGIPYCPDAALAGVSEAEGSGAAQLGSPSCPAASQVGTVSVGAGAGPSPFYVNTGRAYLAGPYKGAPLSLAIVTPALAGPFDLGSVVVRTALRVDPTSAQISAVSDPIPSILHGIPLDIRSVDLSIARDAFTLNPTSCDPMAVTSTITSLAGTTATPSSRFQVGSCERLKFGPKLSLRVKGKARRGAYQQLTARLSTGKGEANIGRVSVALPRAEFLAQNHIGTVCTRVQFAADQCPAKSIYGYAEAKTPLLEAPLKGPVYLRANGGERQLPDLLAALHGQIDINLLGFIDQYKGGIRTRFQGVPDAPVSSFTLRMKGGAKSLIQNSTNICRNPQRATVKMDGQNGKVHDFEPALKTSCGGKGRKKH